jgi:hypothetical protein
MRLAQRTASEFFCIFISNTFCSFFSKIFWNILAFAIDKIIFLSAYPAAQPVQGQDRVQCELVPAPRIQKSELQNGMFL